MTNPLFPMLYIEGDMSLLRRCGRARAFMGAPAADPLGG